MNNVKIPELIFKLLLSWLFYFFKKRLKYLWNNSRYLHPPKTPRIFTEENSFKHNKLTHFLHRCLEILFDNEPPGFFVDAGAADGKIMSNTLYLENSYNWTGLLVEPDPQSYTDLVNRHRNAWTSNICLSTTLSPSQVILNSYENSLKTLFN